LERVRQLEELDSGEIDESISCNMMFYLDVATT
jgi:hypothetical protein